MYNNILINLNDSQQKAVKHIDGPLLILAGAGSGKTKTITTRLIYLVSLDIEPSSILTLTFTNKAANDMQYRAFDMLDNISSAPLLCTFHKFGLLFLKLYIDRLDRKNNFVIIDTEDKKKILRLLDRKLLNNILKESKDMSLIEVSSRISDFKNFLIDATKAKRMAKDKIDKDIATIYKKYEKYLFENNLVDFDDLLYLTYKILDKDLELAEKISQKYKYIMVDEYQDTNDLQNKLLFKLSDTHNNLCVVGDDDQTIYEWRGANYKNILNFNKNFKDITIIKLEKNYRSSSNILKHANLLIEHNRNRIDKKLISTKEDGESVKVYESQDENEEAKKIGNKILELIELGENPANIAILFRIHALSRALEENFNKQGINYQLVGGIKFYERGEIKDLIAFFRFIINTNDDFSLKRIINKPKKGIGKVTVEKLEKYIGIKEISIFKLLSEIDDDKLIGIVGERNKTTLKLFVDIILKLQKILKNDKLNFIDYFEKSFNFKESFTRLIDAQEKKDNIDDFYSYCKEYFIKNEKLTLKDFINEISLDSEQNEFLNPAISMMSIHASKGLEYKYIFIVGLEEGFLPILGDGTNLEEERRLGYVAITRAKEYLVLSYVRNRFYKGKRTALVKSRFLSESGVIKGSLVFEKNSLFSKGDAVKHNLFGLGRVDGVNKSGKDFQLKINFGGIIKNIFSSFVEKI